MSISIKLLASGSSSVSESEWFLVGFGNTDVFLIISAYGGLPKSEEKWHVIGYSPGMDWNEGKEVFGQVNELLIDACINQEKAKNINWNDNNLASELYWDYLNK